MKTVAIVQARLGGSRLPRKVMADLCGVSMLRRVVERLEHATLDKIVVAIPDTPENDELETYIRTRRWNLYRGSEDDVLSRYVGAAEAYEATTIVRVTADCPFVDPGVVNALARLIRDEEADFAFTSSKLGKWPLGLDVQAFTADLLREAGAKATEPFDREHVVPYMFRLVEGDETIDSVNLQGPAGIEDYSNIRLTVDSQEDLIRARAIYEALSGKAFFTTQDVFELLDRRAELRQACS